MSVYSVNVYPSSTTIRKGNWYYGTSAVVDASSNCNTDVTWYSNNTSVATVNASSGYIYAKAEGTARIYAQSTIDSSKKDYITVTVTSGTICVDSVTLNRSSVSLEKGDTFTLSAAICPTNATNKSIGWRSTNTGVATVSGGVVTAKARGYAYIYADAQDCSGEYDSCYVNVTDDILVTSVTVSPSSKTMNIGSSAYLYETVCPTNATNKCVKWSSNKTSVATVNPDTGLVIAQGAGTATITVTAQDGSNKKGYCIITVNAPVAVTGVDVCPTNLPMNVGDIEYLCASITPSNATNQTVTWCSSNENVATVGLYTGKVIAKKAGTTTITATTVDGGLQDCITITVNYCGASNYRDVTKHNMIFQSDGHFVCSKCGYRIMSPSLQDNLILSADDYLKVIALSHYYSQMILLADKYPLKSFYYNSFANSAKIAIDTIRSKNEYAQLYDYKGSNGKYYCTETNDTTVSFVASSNINALTLGSYNGFYESIAEFVLGYYCPEVALLGDIIQLVTEESNALDFGALVASLYDLDDYANALSIASTVLGMATSEVQIGDRVINISFNAYSHAEYVFDEDNRIKEVRIFNNF